MKTQHGARSVAPVESHRLYFDGVGSEYFRVWLGNLLLGIATLGLYTPWARRRNAQYLFGCLEVAEGRLACTLPPWCLALGAGLLLALCSAGELALRTGQTQTLLLVGLGVLALLPWAWASATRQRLGHTRWRGLNLHLRAGPGEIYAAAWPLFALALLWAGVGLALAALGAGEIFREGGGARASVGVAALLGLAGLLTPVWLARLHFNGARLAVQRAQVGAEVGHWTLDFSPFLRVALASLGVFLLSLLAVAACGALAAGFGLLPRWHGGATQFALAALAAPILGVMLFVPALAYHDARTFQLVWNHVGVGRCARFTCTLPTRAYVLLRLRNAMLTALTLGAYLPFSRVQGWRMKTGSVTLFLRGEADELAETLARQHAAIFGGAAAKAHRLELLSAAMAGTTR